ncbi:hypothetical protein BGW39_001539 [Mortierella sp. 14UC]|nr:hypothetical protein BGW39_001539 [Mortierella sp. 14UC]
MPNSIAGLTIDTSGVARYNGIPLKADQAFPGSRVRTARTPNTIIRVLGKDLPYIEARLHTLQRPWQWVNYYTKTDLSESRSCSIRIVAEDFGFDAAQFGEVAKSLFSKDYNVEKGIFLFNFSTPVKPKKKGKTEMEIKKVDKNYYRLRSSTSLTAEKALSASCGCIANVSSALAFPDHFTKTDREFGYQARKFAQYRTGIRALVEFALKPYQENDRFQQKVLELPLTHKQHTIYNISKEKAVEVVRKCARFFQIFYPTSTDKDHFTNAVDDIYESVTPASPVNNDRTYNYGNARPPAYSAATATDTTGPFAANNGNSGDDPYKQLEVAMEAIARLQLKDMLAHGTNRPVKKQVMEAALKERMKALLDASLNPVLTTAMSKETSEYVQEKSQVGDDYD